MMFISILLMTIMSTIARVNPAQLTGSLTEHLMRATHNFDLKCFREIQLKEDPSFFGYLSCGKKNTLSFTSRESGMIRKIYISKAKRLTCGQPSCSIESEQMKRPWDGTGLCARSNEKNLHSGRKIAHISSSSHYSKIIYGIEDHIDSDYRILTLEKDRAGGSCEHVVHRSSKQSSPVTTRPRRTYGLTTGLCNKRKTDKCIFVCVKRKLTYYTSVFKEPEFQQGNLTARFKMYRLWKGSDSVFSISMASNQKLFVLTYTNHKMLMKLYVMGPRKWKFDKSNPMEKRALYLGIGNFNSNMFITRKRSIVILFESKTIYKDKNELVCWCNDGKEIAIVNKFFPFERKLTLIF